VTVGWGGRQALMGRIPDSFTFDTEMQIFVKDVEHHEAYKRGKAVPRQVGACGSIPCQPCPGFLDFV
jgi:hypothetical protein